MKNYLMCLVVLGLLCFTAYAEYETSESIYYRFSGPSVPSSPVKSTGSFQTSLLTGAATYSYPIQVPAGTSGLAPSVSLSYSSQGSKKSGLFGVGWDVI
jgi:hypothetical protein